PAEATYLVDDGGSATQPNARFADAGAYMIYEFDLPDTVTSAFARVHVGNQFVVEAARGGETDYTLLKDYYAQTGDAVQNLSNLAIHSFDLTPFLANNPSRTVRIRLSDGIPQDGWGPYLRGIEIVESETAGAFNFTEVLNSQAMFGEDFHNEENRNYYTIDLSRSLTNNNPTRDVYVRFTDGTTSDGWGPGLYWMAAYTGEIDVKSDSLVFPALKTTTGEPASRPVGLIARNYPLNPAKTLSAIKLPSHPLDQSSAVYLLAATLNTAAPQTPPRLSAVAIAGNKIRLSWPAAQGFQLMVTPSLTTPIWSNAGLVAQNTDGIMSVEIDATSRSGFYRLAR
ncbi:MAG TPA: hypothetical protein VEH27_17145, partial [Methylomirabilota bacterium]|nr:hypothetical protein [Methylomirabilota bacterium]